MPTIQERLLKTLDNLGREKLDRFKWHLKKNHDSISVADIEKANSFNTVDIMEAQFTPEGAVKVTLDILRIMNENHLAEQLEKDVGNAVQMSTIDLNLRSGETINAPVLTRNIISNPVSANFSSSSGAVGIQQYYCRTQKNVDPVVKFPSSGLKSQRQNDQNLEITQYACNLTLDPNTAHPNLFLSEGNRKATHMRDKQPYPDHPKRFDWQPQVLCRESLTGRHYWEVEWSTRMWVEIAVTYKGTRCKGADNDYAFGLNARSWVLKCSRFSYLIMHNKNMTNIPVRSSSNRVGVYVDVSAGTLSFYSVSDTHTLTHLHTFNTTFTEPLCAGFGVYPGSSVSLCDIKQPPVRIISDPHITRCCNLRSSGLSIECQSCVHIADPDQWVQIEPSVCTDEGGSKFRVSTRPGRYECFRTRMRWVCDCDVTLQYQTVDGRFLNAELEKLQCNRIAPVMDVTVISGKLEEVHLPHYICLGESEASFRDAVKVLSVEDEGITVEPVQLTRFHAKILQPAFSIKTLIISWIMGWDEHCNLLLYMRSKAPLIFHVYFFPFDDGAKEEVEKIEKSSYSIPHPRPDRPFRMKTPHVLDVPGASVHPKEGITLRREMDPNFFKIKTHLENDLQMTLREKDKKIVWTVIIEKDELDQIHAQRDEPRLKSDADKARYFDNHWSDLIQRVKNVQIIADKLLQQKLIHQEQYSEIKASLTSQNGMRKICDIIHRHSDAVKAKLISILQEEKLFHF